VTASSSSLRIITRIRIPVAVCSNWARLSGLYSPSIFKDPGFAHPGTGRSFVTRKHRGGRPGGSVRKDRTQFQKVIAEGITNA
jgi:hypothetical protein